jgi:hypothetical protein
MSTFAGALGRGLAGYAQNRERSDARDRDIEQQQRAEARQAERDKQNDIMMALQMESMREGMARAKAQDVRQGEQDRNAAIDNGLRDTEPTRQGGALMRGAAELGASMGGGMGATMGALGSYGKIATEAANGPQYSVGGKSMSRAALPIAQLHANMKAAEQRGEKMADREFDLKRDAQNATQQTERDTRQNTFQAGQNQLNRNATMNAATMRANQPPKVKLPTEGERKAAALYSVAQQGYDTLEGLLVQKGADGKPVVGADKQPVMRGAPSLMDRGKQSIGMGVGNVLTGDQQRQVTQAALQLSDMWMRYTSGASVPETEVARFAQTFTPLPGDDPTTLKQKQAARGRIITALKGAAGRALVIPPEAGTEPDMNDPGFQAFLEQRREDQP